eukprot:gene14599-17261_t
MTTTTTAISKPINPPAFKNVPKTPLAPPKKPLALTLKIAASIATTKNIIQPTTKPPAPATTTTTKMTTKLAQPKISAAFKLNQPQIVNRTNNESNNNNNNPRRTIDNSYIDNKSLDQYFTNMTLVKPFDIEELIVTQNQTIPHDPFPDPSNAAKAQKHGIVSYDRHPFFIKIIEESNWQWFRSAWSTQREFSFSLCFQSDLVMNNTPTPELNTEDEISVLPTMFNLVSLMVTWPPGLSVYQLPLDNPLPNMGEPLLDSTTHSADFIARNWRLAKIILEHPHSAKYMFNGKPMIKMLLCRGIQVKHRILDGKIGAWILYTDKNKESTLDGLVQEFTKINPPKRTMAATWTMKQPEKLHFNNYDRAYITSYKSFHLMQKLLPKLKSEGKAYDIMMDIEMPITWILAKMEYVGIGFDDVACQRSREQVMAKLTYLEHKAKLMLPGMEFSLTSTKDASDIIYTHLKLGGKNPGFKTKSTNADKLEPMLHLHPFVPLLQEHRKLTHHITHNAEGLSKYCRTDPVTLQSRIHSATLQTNAATGRLAMNYPNLQNIANPIEFTLAPSSYGSPPSTHSSDGPLCPLDVVTEINPQLKILDEMESKCDKLEIKVRSAFVAKPGCLFLVADYCQIEMRILAAGKARRKAINTIAQGTAADIVKIAMIKIEKEFEERKVGANMVLQVHDELVFEVPKESFHDVAAIVKRVLESAVLLDIPFPIKMSTRKYEDKAVAKTKDGEKKVYKKKEGEGKHQGVYDRAPADRKMSQKKYFEKLATDGKYEDAKRLLRGMPDEKHTVYAYEQLLLACANSGKFNEAWHCYNDMKKVGVKPTIYTLGHLINVCTTCPNVPNESVQERVNQLLGEIEKYNVKVSVTFFNILMKTLIKIGKYDDAIKFVDRMKEIGARPDIATYTTYVIALAEQYKLADGYDNSKRDLFNQLSFSADYQQLDTLRADGQKQVEQYAAIIQELKRNNIQPDRYFINTILHACKQTKNPEGVFGVYDTFKDMRFTSHLQSDTRTYDILISTCNYTNKIDKGLEIFEELITKNIRPDIGLANNLFRLSLRIAATRQQNVYDIELFIERIMKYMYRYKLVPNSESFTILISTYARLGKLEKVYELFLEMKELSLNDFNQVLEVGSLPETLYALTLGHYYNQPIAEGVLPLSLHTLVFGFAFNNPILPRVLPMGLKSLNLPGFFNHSLDGVLPDTLESLSLGFHFNQPLTHQLPTSLRYLSCYDNPEVGISDQLPPQIKHLTHSLCANVPKLPSTITHLDIAIDQPITRGMFPDTITHLKMGRNFNHPIAPGSLPANLVSLTFGEMFNRPLRAGQLPSGLKHLVFGDCFNQSIKEGHLPSGLKQLVFGHQFNETITGIPSGLTHLTVGTLFNRPIHAGSFPTTLQHLSFGIDFQRELAANDLHHMSYLTYLGYNGRDIPILPTLRTIDYRRMTASIRFLSNTTIIITPQYTNHTIILDVNKLYRFVYSPLSKPPPPSQPFISAI